MDRWTGWLEVMEGKKNVWQVISLRKHKNQSVMRKRCQEVEKERGESYVFNFLHNYDTVIFRLQRTYLQGQKLKFIILLLRQDLFAFTKCSIPPLNCHIRLVKQVVVSWLHGRTVIKYIPLVN